MKPCRPFPVRREEQVEGGAALDLRRQHAGGRAADRCGPFPAGLDKSFESAAEVGGYGYAKGVFPLRDAVCRPGTAESGQRRDDEEEKQKARTEAPG